MNVDEVADRLSAIAAELVVRVRDELPEDNRRWLMETLPDRADWLRLCVVLAAAVPDDRPWSELIGWSLDSLRLRPHGTHAAAQRHRYHQEPLCDLCREAERTRDRNRKRARRAAA